MIQRPPFCIQFEATEGCNLNCSFCGVQGMREKPNSDNRFMTIETATLLANMIAEAKKLHKWNPRLESCMHGEPTLNPNIHEIHRILREKNPILPQMMLSNGGGIVKSKNIMEFIHELRRSGLNILGIDCYNYSKGLWGRIQEALVEAEYPFAWYPDDQDANPHHRTPNYVFRIVLIRDIDEQTLGTHSVLNTHCGAGMPPVRMKHLSPCAKPFRELSIRYDGNVAICCNDYRGEFHIGNIRDFPTLDALWNSDRFLAVRRKLYPGFRDFHPCSSCNAISYRPGLLPDQYGKEDLKAPGPWDEERIKEALADGPWATVVKRSWELGDIPKMDQVMGEKE